MLRGIIGALPVFESAARLLSFTKAAEELNMTQPAVSRRISKLEGLLGAPVFKRFNNHIQLTAEGREFLEGVETGMLHLNDAAERVFKRGEKTKLTVACGFSFAAMWLQPRFSKFRQILNDKEAHLIASESPDDLDPDLIDIRILWRNSSWPDRDLRPLFPEDVLPVCSPKFARKHKLLNGAENNLAQIAELPLLHFNTENSKDLDWAAWFKHHLIDYARSDPAYYYDNYQYAIQAAMDGEGVALAPSYLIEMNIAEKKLIQIGPSVRHREACVFIEFENTRLSLAHRDAIYNWLRAEGHCLPEA